MHHKDDGAKQMNLKIAGYRVFPTFVGLILPLVLLALIGNNGRLVADGYCNCAALIQGGNNPLRLMSALYETWSGEAYSQLIQAAFAWWPAINLSQGWGVAISLCTVFLVMSFVIKELVVLFSKDLSPRTVQLTSNILAFSLIVSLIAPAALPIWEGYEFLTQQSFVAQVFMRYPGLVALAAGNWLLVGLSLAIFRRFDTKGLAYNLTLALLAFLAGLSNYSFTGFFGFLIIGLALAARSGNQNDRVKTLLRRAAVPLTGLIIGFLISYFSPGAAIRKSAIFDGTRERTVLDWIRNGSADAVWAFATPFTFSGLAMFGIAISLGYILIRNNPNASFRFFPKPAIWLGGICALALVTAVPSLISYSAAWHTVFPRSAILLAITLSGLQVGSFLHWRTKFSGRSPLTSIHKVLSLAMVSGLVAMSVGWTSSLPAEWSAGDLPIQPVKSGWGKSIYMSDTEVPEWKDCYMVIEKNLREKKVGPGF